MNRYPRTLNEAFPLQESWRNVLTHYRRPLSERVARAIGNVAVLATFAAIGVMLSWRG